MILPTAALGGFIKRKAISFLSFIFDFGQYKTVNPFLIYCFMRNHVIKFYFIISVGQTGLSYSVSISFTILYPSSFTNTASLLFIGIKSILSL